MRKPALGATLTHSSDEALIEAGAAAVHFEDGLSSAKKCGHLGGKVLVPTREAILKLTAARVAADVLNVPTILIARTDADAAQLITSDADPVDGRFFQAQKPWKVSLPSAEALKLRLRAVLPMRPMRI